MNKSLKLSIQMTTGERVAGFIYLPFYLLINGLAIELIMTALGLQVTELKVNLIYFYVNFVFVGVAFHKFFSDSLSAFFKNLWRSVKGILFGFAVYLILSIVLNILVSALFGDVSNPNNEYISGLYGQSSRIVTIGAVLLGPFAEEALFRGVLFGTVGRKSRFWAYAVSFLLFAGIHVWSYIGQNPSWTLLINLVQYLPPTFALCLAYEKGDNIFCPIVIHMAVNAFAVSAMSAGVLG